MATDLSSPRVAFWSLKDGISLSSASVKGEISGELAAPTGLSTPGSTSSATDSVVHDIITEQPRAQHTLQPDSMDLSTATNGDEEDILSPSSSQISTVPSDPTLDLNDGTQASSPISESSQTTTEGPDSAITPSDSSEIVSRFQWWGWGLCMESPLSCCFFCGVA